MYNVFSNRVIKLSSHERKVPNLSKKKIIIKKLLINLMLIKTLLRIIFKEINVMPKFKKSMYRVSQKLF